MDESYCQYCWHHKIAYITLFTKVTDISKLWMTSHQVWLSYILPKSPTSPNYHQIMNDIPPSLVVLYFTNITKLWMKSHQVWLSSSISIGHSPPLWYSLPIRLWLVGTSWKTRYFCSDFLLREEGRFTFFFGGGERLKRKLNCPFSPRFIYGLGSNLVKTFCFIQT